MKVLLGRYVRSLCRRSLRQRVRRRGAAHATVYGLSTTALSLKGSTGIFELGVSLQPQAKKSALTLDVGLQGYTGKREGVMSGTLKAAWVF